MSGFDKAVLADKLIRLGWVEDDKGRMVPPESLWQNKPESFSEYQAEALQDLLGEPVDDD